MLTVTVDQTGDSATAECADTALLAAVTLCREAYDAGGGTYKPTVTFTDVDGRVIYRRVSEVTLWAQKAKGEA